MLISYIYTVNYSFPTDDEDVTEYRGDFGTWSCSALTKLIVGYYIDYNFSSAVIVLKCQVTSRRGVHPSLMNNDADRKAMFRSEDAM